MKGLRSDYSEFSLILLTSYSAQIQLLRDNGIY